jgi:hypothetical protein
VRVKPLRQEQREPARFVAVRALAPPTKPKGAAPRYGSPVISRVYGEKLAGFSRAEPIVSGAEG